MAYLQWNKCLLNKRFTVSETLNLPPWLVEEDIHLEAWKFARAEAFLKKWGAVAKIGHVNLELRLQTLWYAVVWDGIVKNVKQD